MNSLIPKTKVVRDSNMELLRIVAMLLVMIVHANFRALPVPSYEEANNEVISSILRFFTESFSIICVNVFILLSGWYGIKLKIERLFEFIFQVFFFSVVGFIISLYVTPDRFTLTQSIGNILLTDRWDYWFVKAYLGLYLFSPILNAFIEHATQKQYQLVLILFYIFHTIYGWAFPEGTIYLERGYSAMSFMGLYLLARYIRLYPLSILNKSNLFDLFIYISITILITLIQFFFKKMDIPYGSYFIFYSCPLVIISAVYFMLIFTKIQFKSKFVNWVACSCFAVYLLHSSSFLATPCYDKIILEWFNNLSTIQFLAYVIPFIVFVFITAILLDKVRLVIWKLIYNKFQ